MAEPHTRPGRSGIARTPVRVLLLAGAMLTVVLSGLFTARPAAAATLSAHAVKSATMAARASTAPKTNTEPKTNTAREAPATTDAHGSPTELSTAAASSGGVCSVPFIGDIGELLTLCNAGSGLAGDLNNICSPSVPQPEQATTGLDSMVATPGGTTGGKTLYDNYGVAGQYWAAYGLQCSDMTSLIGNNVAGMVFDMAKSLDRVTITVYQSAAGNGILTWLQNSVNRLISALGKAIYFPFLAPIVILGAIWLAWEGLIRKRATRTIEGTLWMVVACAAAIWLIAQPGDFTGFGSTVSNSVTQVLNTAFANLPNQGTNNCLPVASGDPQSVTSNYAFTSSNGLVDENANELWSVLICKPWLDGEFGTTVYATSPTQKQTVVNTYGRQLLWAQAIAANEQPTQAVITAKQDVYQGIATDLQANYPAVYPLFQGNQWTTRLEIGFSALFAAIAAGLLVLLIALTLIVLKLGFLLLLVLGPFFLLIGTHPGFGRVIAIRWFEMLVGVLLKQIAVALVLSVLLYCYSLIMNTTDTALPWALKIMMIALVTVAVFIYRKPFQHLFSAVGYGVLGSTERAEYSWREASTTFRRATGSTAGVAIPGVAAYRAARWARRNPAAAAAGGAGAAAAGAAAGVSAAASGDAAARAGGSGPGDQGAGGAADGAGSRAGSGRLPGSLGTGRPRPGTGTGGQGSNGAEGGAVGGSAGSAGSAGRGRNWGGAGSGASRAAPPLPLPPPDGGHADTGRGPAAWPGTTAPRQGPSRSGSSGSNRSGGSGSNGSSAMRNNGASGSGTTSDPAPSRFWRPIRRDR
jgi:hypothetical protein